MEIDTNEFKKLKLENELLIKRITELENNLKLYTNNERHKKYYEKNSDVIKHKAKLYIDKIKESNPEKIKEWRHTAYLNRKKKLEEQK
jgi:hypothetical protein